MKKRVLFSILKNNITKIKKCYDVVSIGTLEFGKKWMDGKLDFGPEDEMQPILLS